MQETRVRFLGWEDLRGKEMATHSSILAWRIPMDSLWQTQKEIVLVLMELTATEKVLVLQNNHVKNIENTCDKYYTRVS